MWCSPFDKLINFKDDKYNIESTIYATQRVHKPSISQISQCTQVDIYFI